MAVGDDAVADLSSTPPSRASRLPRLPSSRARDDRGRIGGAEIEHEIDADVCA